VPDQALTPAPPLAGHDRSFGSIRVAAPENLAIVSLALPLGEEDAAERAIETGFGADLPGIGKSLTCEAGRTRLLRLGIDSAFVLFEHPAPDALGIVAAKLGDAAYLTDQTDVWCALGVSGPDCRAALERICPVDLHDDAFAVGDAARTVMEHLGVIVIRTGKDAFLLLSASSSARSFLHAVETSAANVT